METETAETTEEAEPTAGQLTEAEIAAARAEVARLRRVLMDVADAAGAKPEECGTDFAQLADLVRGRPTVDDEILRVAVVLGREPQTPGHTIATLTAMGRGRVRASNRRMVPDRIVLDRDHVGLVHHVFELFLRALRPDLDEVERGLRQLIGRL